MNTHERDEILIPSEKPYKFFKNHEVFHLAGVDCARVLFV